MELRTPTVKLISCQIHNPFGLLAAAVKMSLFHMFTTRGQLNVVLLCIAMLFDMSLLNLHHALWIAIAL